MEDREVKINPSEKERKKDWKGKNGQSIKELLGEYSRRPNIRVIRMPEERSSKEGMKGNNIWKLLNFARGINLQDSRSWMNPKFERHKEIYTKTYHHHTSEN